mmetsp:Transcript_3355/g.8532  ORF Transcript_3355/g.8532 Transcript_3355/m.8532 type:complete len:639 (+) Transcript_3355:106-2022(+)
MSSTPALAKLNIGNIGLPGIPGIPGIPGTAGKGKGRRRLTRQNSWMAWDSRVSAPSVKLDLSIECRRLPKKDSFSDCDAFCGIWEAPAGAVQREKKTSRLPSKQEREVGRTEVVRENENPKFENTFPLEYRFQEEQNYVIRVYDEDLRYATDLKEHDFVGGCVFTLGELMGAAGCTIAKPLQNGKAFVVLSGQEMVETREVLEFRFSGEDLGSSKNLTKKKGMEVVQKFDVYFRLEKLQVEDQSWSVIWKSEVVSDDHNPTWHAARLPLQQLCDDNPSNPLKVTIWLWNRFTPDELIGFVETSVNDLVLQAKRGIPVFDVMQEKNNLFRGTRLKKAGMLKVLKSTILNIPSMLQYLSGGCEMDLMVAVDCTTTNGDWRLQKSLHYSSDTWLNDYQAALFKVGSIFDGYNNTSKGYIMWGYGGKIDGEPQPYFVMGEKIKGADNLVKAYDKVFSPHNKKLSLGEDGALKHIIQAAMFRALDGNRNEKKQCYGTLVILTTGAITDLQDSIDSICAAAEDAPLSIAIIGIGTSPVDDFETVTKLVSGEHGKLQHSNGVPITRDIVQFATMAEFGGNARDCVGEAFREVPEQFVQHFINAGIKPFPPKASTDFTHAEVSGRKESSKGKSSSKSKKKKKSSKH